MKHIHSDQAPQAVGPYSQAVSIGALIFCSGQIGLDPKTMELRESIEDQARQICENISHVLVSAGSGMESVVKTTIFLKDMKDFETVNRIYASFFPHKPARSTVGVNDLPKGAGIEMEAIALNDHMHGLQSPRTSPDRSPWTVDDGAEK